MLLGRDRGQLVRLPEYGQRTIVGEGLVTDRQGELHLDALAAQVAGCVIAKKGNSELPAPTVTELTSSAFVSPLP